MAGFEYKELSDFIGKTFECTSCGKAHTLDIDNIVIDSGVIKMCIRDSSLLRSSIYLATGTVDGVYLWINQHFDYGNQVAQVHH